MQPEIILNTELDLPEKGLDLAKLIFDVARECDTTGGIRGTIDVSGLVDEILNQIEILSLQHENPDMSEDELQKHTDALIAETNRKKEELAVERAAKRDRIKQYIHSNALKGYELAYSICKNENSDEAKELAYHMVKRLKNFSLEEKLEICRQYAESLIDLQKSGNDIAKVYCDMAALVYPAYKRDDYSLCLSFYEKAYQYIDEPTHMLDEIIGFCNGFRLNELREKCKQKKKILQHTI